MTRPTCTVEDCTNWAVARTLCNGHYRRYRIHGDTLGHIPNGHGASAKHLTPTREFQRKLATKTDPEWAVIFNVSPYTIYRWRHGKPMTLTNADDASLRIDWPLEHVATGGLIYEQDIAA